MIQKQKPNLAAALADVSGSTRRRAAPLRSQAPPLVRETSVDDETPSERRELKARGSYQAPSRSGTVPITAHMPKQVRDQLKILAIEQGGTLHNLMAEAYNDLFAKYGKPEIVFLKHRLSE